MGIILCTNKDNSLILFCFFVRFDTFTPPDSNLQFGDLEFCILLFFCLYFTIIAKAHRLATAKIIYELQRECIVCSKSDLETWDNKHLIWGLVTILCL